MRSTEERRQVGGKAETLDAIPQALTTALPKPAGLHGTTVPIINVTRPPPRRTYQADARACFNSWSCQRRPWYE